MACMRHLPTLPSPRHGYFARNHARGVGIFRGGCLLGFPLVWPRRAPPAGNNTRPPVPDFDLTPVAKNATAVAPPPALRGHQIEVGHSPDAASLSGVPGCYL